MNTGDIQQCLFPVCCIYDYYRHFTISFCLPHLTIRKILLCGSVGTSGAVTRPQLANGPHITCCLGNSYQRKSDTFLTPLTSPALSVKGKVA